MPISDTQLQILENLASGFLGVFGAIAVQYIQKKRSRSEVQTSTADTISRAAGESVKTAQSLVDTLQGMMTDQKKFFEGKLIEAKDACSLEISKIKADYEVTISDMEAKIIKITMENASLSRELVKLTFNSDAESKQIEELLVSLLSKVGMHEEQINKMTSSGDPSQDKDVDGK